MPEEVLQSLCLFFFIILSFHKMTNMMEAPPAEAAAEDAAGLKKPRKRMKDVRKRIKSQMEFYFSDSNLQKDRFLKKETEKTEEGYVSIDMFLKFNKIRALTNEVKVIARSLKKSTLLEVSSDETKIRRCVPLKSLSDVDDRTVYVEHLPRNTDHEWVKSLFAQCGEVLYVSLPRFRSTGDLKGFGFVEFTSQDEAAKACELLNNPPPMSGKAGRFPKWNKALCQLTKKTGPIEEMETQDKPVEDKSKDVSEDPVAKQCKKHKRRRRCTSESSQDGSDPPQPQKKRKLDSTDDVEEADGKEDCKDSGKEQVTKEQGETVSEGLKSEEEERKDAKKKKKGKKRLSDANKSVEEDSEGADLSTADKSERKRKRTSDSRDSVEFSVPQAKVSKIKRDVPDTKKTNSQKKKRKRKKKNKEKDVPPPQLKVISKQEWLSLRSEYLSQQKSNMADMKNTLRQQREEKDKETARMEEVQKDGSRPCLEFVTGVIVQVSCSLPMNRKALKEKLPSDLNVAYMDIKDESASGHIRCKDSDSARKIAEAMLENYTFSLLTGDAETQYWDKLKSDRDDKYNNKKKRNKKRGSQKLLEKAHRHNTEVMETRKHIVFED